MKPFDHPTVALIFALREEVSPLLKESKILTRILAKPAILMEAEFRGRKIIFCQTGIGMNHAHEGVEKLLAHFQPSLVLSVGYAGGTDPVLKTGDLVLASEIRSETPTDHFKTDPKAREMVERLIREERVPYKTGPLVTLWKMAGPEEKKAWQQKGLLAVDMETAAIAAVAAKQRVPFVSLRTIFDTLNEELPFPEPTVEPPNPLALVLKNPKTLLQFPKFFRMNQLCQKNLARVIARFIDCFC